MRKYSIGLFLDIFTDKESEWLDSLEFINSLNGVEHLEILPEYIPSNKEFNFFFNLQEQYRFIIHAASLDLTVLSPHKVINSASLSILKKSYQFGLDIGAEVFTVHAGFMPKFWKKERVKKNIANMVTELQKNGGIPICVENLAEKWSIQIPYPCTLEHIEDISRITNLTIDVGHLLKSGTDPYSVIKKYRDKICNIHLHDAVEGQDHMQLGTGDLDLDKLLLVLDKINYDGFLSIEVVGRNEIRNSWMTLLKKLH